MSVLTVTSGRRWLRLTANLATEAARSPTVDAVSVTADGNRRYDWVRLTYPRGRVDAVYGDGRGWILPVPSWALPNRERVFAPLSELRYDPVIVLASAGGTGKSTALAQEHQALAPDAARLVDLKSLAGKRDPVGYLTQETQIDVPLGEGAWHVVLDGFDEAVVGVPGLVGLLDQWLEKQHEPDRGRLRLRLATRPDVLQNAELVDMLHRWWPADGAVTVRDIAPLDRYDVLLAAAARGIADPEAFAAELKIRGLVPAANLPVTLEVLLNQATEGRAFPDSAAEVYQLAVDHLCEETSPGRRRPLGTALAEIKRPLLAPKAGRRTAGPGADRRNAARRDRWLGHPGRAAALAAGSST